MARLVYEFGKEPQSRLHHIWRDVVPLLALLLAFWAVLGNERTADRALDNSRAAKALAASNREIIRSINQSREVAILDACKADVAQDNVLRAILRASIRIRLQRQDTQGASEARRLSIKLMRPLGGLQTIGTKKTLARCERRVRRGSP